MIEFVITYLAGYFIGMFITRHTFLKIIKNVCEISYNEGLKKSEELLRKNGLDSSANIIYTHIIKNKKE